MRLLIRKQPRSIAIISNGYVVIFEQRKKQNITSDDKGNQPTVVECLRESAFSPDNFVEIKHSLYNGLLGLINVGGHIYIGVIGNIKKVGSPRWRLLENGELEDIESIYQVLSAEFFCLDNDALDPIYSDFREQTGEKPGYEHPCAEFEKLFSDGSFYFSRDFDISNVLQERGLINRLDYTLDNQVEEVLWNYNLISEMIQVRSRITTNELPSFDGGTFLTFLIRGFCKTVTAVDGDDCSTITLISKVSAESKENSFDMQGVDKHGNVSNFIETETILCTERYVLGYTQTSGNIPLKWEVTEGQLLHSKKIRLREDPALIQLAFDKHFDKLSSKYGVVSILNLLKPKSESQETLGSAYEVCAANKDIKITNIAYSSDALINASHKLLYLLKQELYEFGAFVYDIQKGIHAGKQTGCLRISAFDSIRKPLLVEKSVSQEIIELTTAELDGFHLPSSLYGQHEKLWTENSFWLENLYVKNHKNLNKYKKVYWRLFASSSRINLHDPFHAIISKTLKKLKKDYAYQKTITTFAGTFNVNGKNYTDGIEEWLFPRNNGLESPADIYVLGFEEVVELTPGHMLSTNPFAKQFWEKKVLQELNSKAGKKYNHAWGGQLGGVLLLLFVSEDEFSKIKHIEGDVKKTGLGGMSANKGAVAVRFTYSATKFCFLVSHLAAGLENVDQRHHDYKTIVKNIRFAKDLRIKDHDVVIWMGDFNYRISLPNEEVRNSVISKNYSKLFDRDQLNQQMIAGESFPYYNEMEISFPPTYKFDPGTKTYDTSEKNRIPAWTDRILSKGEALKQLSYGCAGNLIFSDHRPVYATFKSVVTVVDEKLKANLSASISEKVKEKLLNKTEDEKYAILNDADFVYDDEKLNPQEPLRPEVKKGRKLPPPSSETKKWWVGNSKQVKVVIDVDPTEYMINPGKTANPFVPTDEKPFFVKRDHAS
ncbi:LAMI_0E05644g1_1 [Lachancea mirantina]|uniref:phosphoinositide 5-phosphatase n=1 Tax=Lachancea mirantina TaxID=1230905 RepID=A0A1G4JLA0_9SACH|nr:LAMI_0E05644g1_1 [Lachancea mirantina]